MRRRLGFTVPIVLVVGLLSACSMRQADVQTNTISEANPTAFHAVSNTGTTSIGLAARDGRCASTFAGHAVRASYAFFTSNGHIVFNDACCSNPTFFVNDAAVNAFPDTFDELVVKHEMGHAFGVAHDERTVNLMAPVNSGTPTEVDQANRNTIDFLYRHTDATNGNSGDSTTPGAAAAGRSAPAAHDPVVKALRRRGTGARVTLREGAYETVTYVNHDDAVTVQHSVYTPNQDGRQAAAAQVASAPLTAP